MASKRTKRETQWRAHISDWRSSAQSQVRYCAEHDLCVSTLGYWIKRLREAGAGADAVAVAVAVAVVGAVAVAVAVAVVGDEKLTLVAARPMHHLVKIGKYVSEQLDIIIPARFIVHRHLRQGQVLGVGENGFGDRARAYGAERTRRAHVCT